MRHWFQQEVARQGAWLCALALAPALLAGWLHPQKASWDPNALREGEVLLGTVRGWPAAVLWVDGRSRKEYDRGHLPEALLLNEDEWEELLDAVLDGWSPGQPVVVYCDDRQCQASRHVAERLRATGVAPVYILKGGWQALEREVAQGNGVGQDHRS